MKSLVYLAFVAVLGSALAREAAEAQTSTPTAVFTPTLQQRVEEREAQRRAMLAEQQKRYAEFVRWCKRAMVTDRELAECRVAYRRLWIE
jgi:ribulose kinase